MTNRFESDGWKITHNNKDIGMIEASHLLNTYDAGNRTLKATIDRLTKEKEQLQERNNRQTEYIDTLFKLIEKQEWEMLTSIINEFKESNEQLQREWRDYE